MKKIASLAVLAAASGSFAFDQYLPLSKGKLETDVMYLHTGYLGGYDADGKKQSGDNSPTAEAPSLQVKYGIIDGLDVEVYVEYDINNPDVEGADKVSGLARPQLAVKYAHPELGLGGYLNVAIPVGSKDIVGEEPPTTLFAGIIYGKTFGPAVVNTYAEYQFNTEVEKFKQDAVHAYLQGQYNATDKIGPYLGVDYLQVLEASYDGEAVSKSGGNLLTLKPGANVILNDKMALEFTVPVSVMGKSGEMGYMAPASYGVYAGFYYTIGL